MDTSLAGLETRAGEHFSKFITYLIGERLLYWRGPVFHAGQILEEGGGTR